MSTNLRPIEAADGRNPYVGGFIISFDDGNPPKVVSWQSEKLISPALDAAKEYTVHVVDSLLRDGRRTAVDATNWVSVTAAVHKLIRDYNGRLHALESLTDASTQ